VLGATLFLPRFFDGLTVRPSVALCALDVALLVSGECSARSQHEASCKLGHNMLSSIFFPFVGVVPYKLDYAAARKFTS